MSAFLVFVRSLVAVVPSRRTPIVHGSEPSIPLFPPALEWHLDFHVTRLEIYDVVRQDVDSLVDRKLALQAGGATDLDVDGVSRGEARGHMLQALQPTHYAETHKV